MLPAFRSIAPAFAAGVPYLLGCLLDQRGSAPLPPAAFWKIEDGLAGLCGFNDSKYEWALRQYYYEWVDKQQQ